MASGSRWAEALAALNSTMDTRRQEEPEEVEVVKKPAGTLANLFGGNKGGNVANSVVTRGNKGNSVASNLDGDKPVMYSRRMKEELAPYSFSVEEMKDDCLTYFIYLYCQTLLSESKYDFGSIIEAIEGNDWFERTHDEAVEALDGYIDFVIDKHYHGWDAYNVLIEKIGSESSNVLTASEYIDRLPRKHMLELVKTPAVCGYMGDEWPLCCYSSYYSSYSSYSYSSYYYYYYYYDAYTGWPYEFKVPKHSYTWYWDNKSYVTEYTTSYNHNCWFNRDIAHADFYDDNGNLRMIGVTGACYKDNQIKFVRGNMLGDTPKNLMPQWMTKFDDLCIEMLESLQAMLRPKKKKIDMESQLAIGNEQWDISAESKKDDDQV